MTAREDVLARLERAAPELRTHAARELWLFGSTAREEMRAGSDVDILVNFSAPRFKARVTRSNGPAQQRFQVPAQAGELEQRGG